MLDDIFTYPSTLELLIALPFKPWIWESVFEQIHTWHDSSCFVGFGTTGKQSHYYNDIQPTTEYLEDAGDDCRETYLFMR